MKFTKKESLICRNSSLGDEIRFWVNFARVLQILQEDTLSLACDHKVVTLQENLGTFSYQQWIAFGEKCHRKVC